MQRVAHKDPTIQISAKTIHKQLRDESIQLKKQYYYTDK